MRPTYVAGQDGSDDLVELPLAARPALLSLLRSHLPQSLPVYNSVLDEPFHPVFISFSPDRLEVDGTIKGTTPLASWLAIVHFVTQGQIRLYHSFEKGAAAAHLSTPSDIHAAESLLLKSVRDFAKLEGVTSVKLGAINVLWKSAIAREFQPSEFDGRHVVWICADGEGRPLALSSSSPTSLPVTPPGFVVTHVDSEQVSIILSTSLAPHSPTYLLTRLPHSTALFTPAGEAVAYCFTHLDGSIGTLAVAPPFRRRGYGKLVMQIRQTQEGNTRPTFSYVGETNEGSQAVMRSLGRTKKWSVFWVTVNIAGVGNI